MFEGNQNQFFEAAIFQSTGKQVEIRFIHFVTGGCINQTIQLDTSDGRYFLKWNEFTSLDMFEKEVKGLEAMRGTSPIRIPEVMGFGQIEEKAYLLLEFIDSYPPKPDYWTQFGEGLAEMHHAKQAYFGWEVDNYIGSLPQNNEKTADWLSFFIEKRLRVQFGLAYYKGIIGKEYLHKLDQLASKLEDFFPKEPPALLHGDLWSGNAMIDQDGKPCMVDPAVYFGHREMEIAFTQLFGGFDPAFYEAYKATYPLNQGFNERKAVYNCYPLMVHVNLFGTSYLSGIDRVFERFK